MRSASFRKTWSSRLLGLLPWRDAGTAKPLGFWSHPDRESQPRYRHRAKGHMEEVEAPTHKPRVIDTRNRRSQPTPMAANAVHRTVEIRKARAQAIQLLVTTIVATGVWSNANNLLARNWALSNNSTGGVHRYRQEPSSDT